MIDCKYFEISGKSYYFLIIPILGYMFVNPLFSPISLIVSFIMILILMMLSDKLIGIEKIGGADVKLLLTMSLLFSYYEIVTIVFIIFLTNLLLLIFARGIFYLLRKKLGFKTVKIPMIVSIFLSVVIAQYFCYFVLY